MPMAKGMSLPLDSSRSLCSTVELFDPQQKERTMPSPYNNTAARGHIFERVLELNAQGFSPQSIRESLIPLVQRLVTQNGLDKSALMQHVNDALESLHREDDGPTINYDDYVASARYGLFSAMIRELKEKGIEPDLIYMECVAIIRKTKEVSVNSRKISQEELLESLYNDMKNFFPYTWDSPQETPAIHEADSQETPEETPKNEESPKDYATIKEDLLDIVKTSQQIDSPQGIPPLDPEKVAELMEVQFSEEEFIPKELPSMEQLLETLREPQKDVDNNVEHLMSFFQEAKSAWFKVCPSYQVYTGAQADMRTPTVSHIIKELKMLCSMTLFGNAELIKDALDTFVPTSKWSDEKRLEWLEDWFTKSGWPLERDTDLIHIKDHPYDKTKPEDLLPSDPLAKTNPEENKNDTSQDDPPEKDTDTPKPIKKAPIPSPFESEES